MQNAYKSKYFLVFSLVLIILLAVYLFNLKNPKNTPTQVLTPDSYESGTTVSLYKDVPPGFPEGVVLENKELNYSGTVASKDGREQITVSYFSSLGMSEAVELYKSSLGGKGWKVAVQSQSKTATVTLAVMKNEEIVVTFAPTPEKGLLVTFQYEK